MSLEILIVDFGSQTTHLIARRFRQLGVEAEIVEPQTALIRSQEKNCKGLIFSGGPASVYEAGAPSIDRQIYKLEMPILGICYGWQRIAYDDGGRVEQAKSEYGSEKFHVKRPSEILENLPDEFPVISSHGDSVIKLPGGFEVLGSTNRVEYAATYHPKKRIYGLQFHPEHHSTEGGIQIFRNFARICGLDFNPSQFDADSLIRDIKEKVGKKEVLCAVSGGIDSTVAAAIIGRAIREKLRVVYVDSSLMRLQTEERVRTIFSSLVKANLTVVDAGSRFLDALKGVKDPERKRKIVGRLYIKTLEEEASKYPDVAFLGQGTIYSDVIESKGSKYASLIKSHHNVAGLPRLMRLKLVEPLRGYYKDEVREIGGLLGLPEEVVMQQPFPGPGYSVRIRGEVTEARLNQVRAADQIIIEEVKKAGLYDQVFQCFAVMTGARSTSVKGDKRAFDEVVAVRVYQSIDVMDTRTFHLPDELEDLIINRIVNEVPGVSRVVYDYTPKPPATMEWE